jgi:hypothetical protein
VTDPGQTPSETLRLLRSECEVCGAWGVFTGRTEWHDGLTFAVVRCPQEGVEFTVWSERGATVLAAYERARATSRPDLGVVPVIGGRIAHLTRPPEPTPGDVRAAVGLALDPPPLGAREVLVDGGWLPTVEVRWDEPEVSRADLDALFGVGQELPRAGPYSPWLLAYDVPTPGAPSKVVVFAGFAEVPAPDVGVTSLLWRVDLPPAG